MMSWRTTRDFMPIICINFVGRWGVWSVGGDGSITDVIRHEAKVQSKLAKRSNKSQKGWTVRAAIEIEETRCTSEGPSSADKGNQFASNVMARSGMAWDWRYLHDGTCHQNRPNNHNTGGSFSFQKEIKNIYLDLSLSANRELEKNDHSIMTSVQWLVLIAACPPDVSTTVYSGNIKSPSRT
jgi:hypothetical protein